MSSPELRLALDRADHSFCFGEVITGTAEVSVDSECQCSALLAVLEWCTHGSGAIDSGRDVTLKLFEGIWLPGEVYQYPFSFVAPNGPATYHGHLLNVDWHVRVQADVIGAKQLKAEEAILLSPRSPQGTRGRRLRRRIDPNSSRRPAQQADLAPSDEGTSEEEMWEAIDPGLRWFWGGLALLGLSWFFISKSGTPQMAEWFWPKGSTLSDLSLFLLGGSFFSLFVWRAFPMLLAPRLDAKFVLSTLQGGSLRPDPTKSLLGAIMLVISFGVGLTLLWLSHFTTLAGGALALLGLFLLVQAIRQLMPGSFAVQVGPSTAGRGNAITCKVRIRRPPSGSLSVGTASLSAWETVESGLRNGNLTYRHMVYEKSFPLVVAPSDRDDDRLILKAQLTVPDEAPITFSGRHNELTWNVGVRVGIDGSPSLTLSYPIVICT